MSSTNPNGSTRRPRRLIRRLGIAGGLLLALLIVLVIFAPAIASRFAPGFIRGAAQTSVSGAVAVDNVSLSWRGPQRIKGFRLADPNGGDVANISVEASTSLLGLLRGSRDLGTLKVSGELVVKKDADGNTTLARAVEPPSIVTTPGVPAPTKPPSGGPSRLPAGLGGKLVMDGLSITYLDAAGGPGSDVRMPGIKGDASFKVGEPIKASFLAAGTVDGRPASVKLDATVDRWSTPDGQATPENATLDAVFDLSAPGALLSALASAPGAPPELGAIAEEWAGSGQSVASVRFEAKGDGKRLNVDLKGSLEGAQADVGLVLSDLSSGGGGVTTTRPATIRATLTPRLVQRLAADSGATLSAPVTIESTAQFSAPLPGGSTPDLRGASLSASVRVSDISGTVRVPGEAGARSVRVAPTTVTIDSVALEQGVTVNAQTAAVIDGADAGSLSVDLTAEGLLDAKGAPRAPRALRGAASLSGLASALVQPFVRDAGLDLARDVGPTIDLSLSARSAGEPSQGDLPPTDLTLQARSANIRAEGSLRLEGDRVRTSGAGIRAAIADASPFLRRSLEQSGVALISDAPVGVTATLSTLEAMLPAGGQPFDLRTLVADGTLGVSGLSARFEGEDVRVSNIEAAASLAPDRAPSASLRASVTNAQRSFPVEADFTLPGLISPEGGVTPANVRPDGSLVVHDVPVDLARLAGLGDMLDLVRSAVGESVTLSVRSKPGGAGEAEIDLAATGARASASARATLRADAIELAGGEATTQITPALVDQAVRRFAPDMTRPPRLDSPVAIRATIGSLRIPLRDGKPDLAGAGSLDASVALAGPLVLRGLNAGDGRSVDVALDGVKAGARAPLTGKGRIDGSFEAGLFDPAAATARSVGSLQGQATIIPEGASQRIEGVLRVDALQTAYVDALLGKPGLLSLAVGDSANLKAEARPGENGVTSVSGSVEAPRLTARFAGMLGADRFALSSPLSASWTPSEQWMLRYALAGDASAVSILGDTPVELRVDRAAFALGEGPLKPGVFELSAQADVRGITMATADGQRVRVESARAVIESPSTGALTVDAALKGVRGASGEAGDATLKASLSNLADDAGRLTPERAVLSAAVDGSVPTALLDALGHRDGLLLEALGPTTTMHAKADGLSSGGGSLQARAATPRADATIVGDVRDGVFHSTEPIKATIHEITPELSRRLMEAIFPLFTSMQKRPADGPAVATVTDLQLPVRPEIDSNGDGAPDVADLRKLNADVRVELGRMSYTTNDLFGKALKATKNRSEGQLFNRFPPLDVRIREGVAQYERTAFPIGEFSVETRGKVDLATRQMDIIVYVPLIGLADEFIGVFRAAPGFNDAAPVPFRMKGPIGKAVPVPAPDLMLKEAVQQPGKIIEEVGKGLEDLFRKKK